MHSPKTGQSGLRSHRGVLEVMAAAGLTIAGFFGVLGDLPAPVRAESAALPMDQLMAVQALADVALGKSDAPVTIVEYASMTCGHCAAFYGHLSGTEKQIYRYRQGPFHLARVSARPLGNGRFHARPLRRRRQAQCDRRSPLHPTEELGFFRTNQLKP